MKKQTRYCLIMLVVLVLAGAAYGVLYWWNSGAEEREAADTVYIAQLDGVTQLSISGTEGNGLSFVQTDGTWYWADSEDFPLEQEVLTDITDLLAALTAERVIDTPDDLSDYGLDDPAYVVSGTDGNGEAFTLSLGDYNSSYTYYAMLEGDDSVYTITSDLKYAIDFELLEAAAPEDLPSMSSTDVASVTIQTAGETHELVKVTTTEQVEVEQDTGEVDEDGNAIMETVTEEETTNTWYLDGEVMAGDGLTDYLSSLYSLSFSTCAAFQPEDLSAYGLDEAARTTVTVELEDGDTLVLWLGSVEGGEETAYYAKTADGVLVYSLSADSGLTDWSSIAESGDDSDGSDSSDDADGADASDADGSTDSPASSDTSD